MDNLWSKFKHNIDHNKASNLTLRNKHKVYQRVEIHCAYKHKKCIRNLTYKQDKLNLPENLKSIEKELNKAFISENIDIH